MADCMQPMVQSVEEHRKNMQKYANDEPLPYEATRRVVVHEGPKAPQMEHSDTNRHPVRSLHPCLRGLC